MGNEDRAEFNDWRDWENIEFDVPDANTEITFYMLDGTDTDTVKYLNKGSLATGFVLRPSAAISLISIQTKTFRNPITISTAGLSVSKHLKDFNKMVIKTTIANTNIKLLVT